MLARVTCAIIALNIIFYAFFSFVNWSPVTIDMISGADGQTRLLVGFVWVWLMIWTVALAAVSKR